MKKYYVYAHLTNDGEVFYIGKGSGKRQFQTGNRSHFWKRIVKKHGFKSVILKDGLSEEEAFTEEIKLIGAHKKLGKCRANFTIGGDGVRVEKRWWNEAISNAMKGKNRNSGRESKSYKHGISKEQLTHWYVDLELNTVEIAKKCGMSCPTITSRLREYGIEVRNSGRQKVRIKCIEDGKVFQSINDASRHYQLFRENIRKVLNGKSKHTGGKRFCYVDRQDSSRPI